MDDLISRQTLMKEFSDFVRASNNSDFVRTPTWNDAVSLVESIPSAQPERKTEDFEKGLHDMFDHIWDCEIEHPMFEDTVGELMQAVIQLYRRL